MHHLPAPTLPRSRPSMSAEAMRAWPLAGLSPRDQRILALTSGKLRGSRVDFSLALQALHEAVCETIPAGRIFLLASEATSPVFGSALSGVGLVEGSDAVQLVRVVAGKLQTLGRLLP